MTIRDGIKQKYEIRELNEFKWFLNIRIIRDRQQRKLWLCQDAYIDKIVRKYHLEHARRAHTPLSQGIQLEPYTGQATDNEIHAYQQRVGSITYSGVSVRPDVAHAARQLAEFLTNPSPRHLMEVERVIAYLDTTKYLAIEYSGNIPDLANAQLADLRELRAAGDASFADDASSRRSTQGYVIQLFNGPIAWQSNKQRSVTTSTTEAELLALSHVGGELQFLSRIFKAIDFTVDHDIGIDCDNQQTVRIVNSKDPTITTKLRHVNIHQFWLRQEVQEGRLQVQWIPTAEMPADGLTKALGRQSHENFIRMLGLVNIHHLIN